MNITELRYLVAIMKWGSVSAAAKQMYAAQPNVSKALKNLEEEYGIRMFERSSTGMIPTEQGRHFIEQAQRVLQEVDRLDADARRRQGECAELRVALPHATYASYAAVDFLHQAAGSEQLRVHIREAGSMEGLDFVLTAMFVVIFLDQWLKEENHTSAILGLALSLLCLLAFGADGFIIPSMVAILAVLTLLRKPIEKGGEQKSL